mmetsp:Transcript_3944/g.5144  ORF Transcript_3944/g.5144 Transcript_3944/m.5144 type:complete len:383 (-) Transcript_3944:2573-3721(-)
MLKHCLSSTSSSRCQSTPFAALSAVALSTTTLAFLSLNTNTALEEQQQDEESRNFLDILNHHKRLSSQYKHKWNWDNANSRIPTVSWPTDIPEDDSEIAMLKFDLKFCNAQQQQQQKEESNAHTSSRYCNNLQFRIASYMLLQQDAIVQKQGLAIIKKLAELRHPDAMCAYAACLNDGRAGLEPDPNAAASWWKQTSDTYNHIQSSYEIGVAFYTGEGVSEDEELAVEYFKEAAESGHAGASYLLGDCLLDGVGIERDRGEALEWLVTAAELGHRGARSRVLAVLEKKEGISYGDFTDASRQTLVEPQKQHELGKSGGDGNDDDDLKQQHQPEQHSSGSSQRKNTRPVSLEHRFTIGGGGVRGNPLVLARRKTIVQESRQHE